MQKYHDIGYIILLIVFFAFLAILLLFGFTRIKEDNMARKKFQSDLAEYETNCGLAGGITVKFKNTYMCMDPAATIEVK